MIYLSKIKNYWTSNGNQLRGEAVYQGYKISVIGLTSILFLEFNHEMSISISSIPWITKQNFHQYPNLEWLNVRLWRQFNGIFPKT